MKRVLPASCYNPLSLIGAVIVVFNIGLMIFLTIVDMLSKLPSAYAGIIILIILPVFILIGAVFLVTGIVRERRRQAAGLPIEHRLPVLDFNDQRQRKIPAKAAAAAPMSSHPEGWAAQAASAETPSHGPKRRPAAAAAPGQREEWESDVIRPG